MVSVVASGPVIDIWERIQNDVVALYNNTSRARGQNLQRSGAPTRTLKHRLTGKTGRLRENMMGKRTNQSARSVVSPDPTLDIDEIGLPVRVATTLTIPEPVNKGNVAHLTRRVRIGARQLGGAATVVCADGTVIDLEMCTAERRAQIRLRVATHTEGGDVVERYLTDGSERAGGGEADVVVFNRQPSLHKFGMMGHRVRILPGDTFRLSELAARPYNADFDGDEMNVHVPQSACARAEVRELMMVSQLLISPQGNRPVLGLVQDSLLGVHVLTDPAVRLTRSRMHDLLQHVRFPQLYRVDERPDHPDGYSGRQVVSALLPRIHLERPGDDPPLSIVGGRMRSGQLSKAAVGAAAGGVVQVIAQDYGSPRAARFLSDLQSVVMRFLAVRGFSMGIGACVLPRLDARRAVADAVDRVVSAAAGVINDAETHRTYGMEREAESAVLHITSGALSRTGQVVAEHMAPDNALGTMIRAGSKGNPVNYTQIMGCVGQNCVEGGRIGVAARRTLPCFAPNDRSVEAHGFVHSSYMQGLQPHEFFFHAMGGREGLVDTAVKTAVTGYLQRRGVKGLEEKAVAHVPHDPLRARRPVVSARTSLVKLHYGGDGCDAARLDKVALGPLLRDEARGATTWAATRPSARPRRCARGCCAAAPRWWAWTCRRTPTCRSTSTGSCAARTRCRTRRPRRPRTPWRSCSSACGA